MEPKEDFICFRCKHMGVECPAFPDGIVEEIIRSNSHDKPIAGQVGNYVFEPIEDEE